MPEAGKPGGGGSAWLTSAAPPRCAGRPEQDVQQSLLLLRGRDAGGRRVPQPLVEPATRSCAAGPGFRRAGRGPSGKKSVAGHPEDFLEMDLGKTEPRAPAGDGPV